MKISSNLRAGICFDCPNPRPSRCSGVLLPLGKGPGAKAA